MTSLFDGSTTADQVLEGLDLAGKVFLITGGNSGLGMETARALAARGAEIILTAREAAKAAVAVEAIRASVPAARLQTRLLDLASLQQVRAFTDTLRKQVSRLDGIVANAGIMATDEVRTADGFESQFATNHLGHFVLVNRLADLLGPGARLVVLSSGAHRLHDVDLHDPNFLHKPYDRWDAYGQSKSANALFALAFDRRWQGRGVRAFAVAPGIIRDTNLHHHLREEHFAVLRSRQFTGKLPRKSLAAGAATPVFALVHPSLNGAGGNFLEDCGFSKTNPDTREAEGVIPWVQDEAHAEAVWALSEKLVGESFPPPGAASAAPGGTPSAAGGLAGNRLPSTRTLEGQALAFALDSAGTVRLAFQPGGSCHWEGLPGLQLPSTGTARVDVVEAAPGAYFVDLLLDAQAQPQTVVLAFDSHRRRALFVATAMGERTAPPPGRVKHAVTTRFRQHFASAVLLGGEALGPAPAPTRALIGTRALYHYSPETVYEHVYLNSGWYAYNSIRGLRRGDAGCDEVTAWRLTEDVLVLAWREVLIDMAAIFVYDMRGLRTTGKAWGTPGGEAQVRNIPAGARIQPLNRTDYPAGMEPA